jgi:hypothetical protein
MLSMPIEAGALSMERTRLLGLSLLLAMAALGAACSALQIDVDVYKGPLANEAETQARQFAALAISAKPLLASLRNDIESTYLNNQSGSTKRFAPRERAALDRYMKAGEGELNSPLARFVNGVLLSYEDLDESPQARAKAAAGLAQAALDRFAPGPPDKALADLIAHAAPAGKLEAALAGAYIKLLCPDQNALKADCGGPLSTRLPGMGKQEFLKACESLRAARQGADPVSSALTCPKEDRSNGFYVALQDASMVEVHAQQIFGRPDERFVSRVTEIARSFTENRSGMRELFLAGLDMLEAARGDIGKRTAAAVVGYATNVSVLACFLAAQPRSVLPGGVAASTLAEGSVKAGSAAKRAADLQNNAFKAPIETAALLRWMDAEVQNRNGEEFGTIAPVASARGHWPTSRSRSVGTALVGGLQVTKLPVICITTWPLLPKDSRPRTRVWRWVSRRAACRRGWTV